MQIVTHSGIFHADEISAIALLKIFKTKEIKVSRVPHQSNDLDKFDLVIDIGRKFDGKKYFDHHQWQGGKSSAGLIWEYIGKENKYPLISKLVKIIDLQDTGKKQASDFEYPNLIKLYNYKDIYSDKQNEAFLEAVDFAVRVFNSLKEKDEKINKAKEILDSSAYFEEFNDIIKLSFFTPYWTKYINGELTPNIKAVVWQDSSDNSYKIRVVPKKDGSFELNAKPLQQSNIMEFVHSNGFFAVAKDKESLVEYLKSWER